jgi:predicted nucleic acid-binding protein
VPFVSDCSFAVGWLLKETDRHGVLLVHRVPNDQDVAPSLWPYEIRNVLLMAERHGRITPPDFDGLLNQLAGLPVDIDLEPDHGAAALFARRHSLTFYDAVYLEIAIRRSLPMATLDRELVNAARLEGVPLVPER